MPSSISSNESERDGIDLSEKLDPYDDIETQEEFDEDEAIADDDLDDDEPEDYLEEEETQDPETLDDETQGKTQDGDDDGGQGGRDENAEEDGQAMPVDGASASIPAPKRGRGRPPGVPSKKEDKDRVTALKAAAADGERVVGKSSLPASRVSKIIKADKDIPIVAKDAVFLISLATEEFIRRFVGAGQRYANNENRATVQHKDLFAVAKRIDEFMFLEDLIPHLTAEIQEIERKKAADRDLQRQKKLGGKTKPSEPPGKGGIQDFLSTTKRPVQEADSTSQDGDDVVMQDGI